MKELYRVSQFFPTKLWQSVSSTSDRNYSIKDISDSYSFWLNCRYTGCPSFVQSKLGCVFHGYKQEFWGTVVVLRLLWYGGRKVANQCTRGLLISVFNISKCSLFLSVQGWQGWRIKSVTLRSSFQFCFISRNQLTILRINLSHATDLSEFLEQQNLVAWERLISEAKIRLFAKISRENLIEKKLGISCDNLNRVIYRTWIFACIKPCFVVSTTCECLQNIRQLAPTRIETKGTDFGLGSLNDVTLIKY